VALHGGAQHLSNIFVKKAKEGQFLSQAIEISLHRTGQR
jgi:hypothetical protein